MAGVDRSSLESRITDAELELRIAEAVEGETLAGEPVTDLEQELAAARDALATAELELSSSQFATGAWLPMSEVAFVPELPVVVQQVAVTTGARPDGTLLTVSANDPVVRTEVSASDRDLLTVGTAAQIIDESSGAVYPARVAAIGAGTGQVDTLGDLVEVLLEPDTPFPADALGRNVRVDVEIATTGASVLLVPAAALSTSMTGVTTVEVEHAEGSSRVVEVDTGLAANGLVEVAPQQAGELAEGDLVIVGRAASFAP